MPAAKAHASTILAEFEKAQAELVGRAVVLTDGKAGTVENLWLDELHGIRLSNPRARWEMACGDRQIRGCPEPTTLTLTYRRILEGAKGESGLCHLRNLSEPRHLASKLSAGAV